MALDLDIIRNKKATIERCINRIDEEYGGKPENLNNFTKQDSIILNLQRACEASIDLAMHVCAKSKFGIPQKSSDAFAYLKEKDIISKDLCTSLMGMVGFRNIAVHDYQALNLEVLQIILEKHLGELIEFSRLILNMALEKS